MQKEPATGQGWDFRIITAIRRGLLYMMPLVLIGSTVLTLLNIPVPAVQNGLTMVFGEGWREVLLSVYTATFQVMSLTALVATSYALASEQPQVKSGEINTIMVVLVAFASYVAFFGDNETILGTQQTASPGMFGAIVVAILSSYLFLALARIRALHIKLLVYDSDTILMSSLYTLAAAMLTVLSFALVRLLSHKLGVSEFFTQLYGGMQDAFHNGQGSLAAAILYILVTHLLWLVGLHGTNIFDGVARDLFLSASEMNILQVASGEAPTQILTKEFFDAFVYIGGCGTTLGLLIALLVAGRRSKVNRLAKFSLLPGLFNINEMMVYGLPIIFNPFYVVPFLLTPVVLCLTTYAAMAAGLVPLTVARVEWTTPIIVSAYTSTGGSVAAVVLQLVNLALAILIYVPFIHMYERNLRQKSTNTFHRLAETMSARKQVKHAQVLGRSDETGVLARALVTELRQGLEEGGTLLHLVYQPKVDDKGNVFGAEALLRWNHSVFGAVSPMVILGLCDEAELGNQVNRWVFDRVLRDCGNMQEQGFDNITLSMNLSPKQLLEDEDLVEMVKEKIRRYGVDPAGIEFELTEHVQVDEGNATRERLARLRELGANIAIDDFGMGYSSILYLRDYYANVVKIDMSLVQSITSSKGSQEIVRAITQLCGQLDAQVVAEGVETKEQLEILESLGCKRFQGHFFGMPLPFHQFIQMLNNKQAESGRNKKEKGVDPGEADAVCVQPQGGEG